MEKTFYIDSNIFIFACSDENELGTASRHIIEMIINGKIKAFTSILTLDEVFYKIMKLKDRDTALKTMKMFLDLKNLNFVEVDFDIANYSYSILKNTKLSPRDAIHLACALSKDAATIISEDKDFDNIKEIERINVKNFKYK